MIILLIAGIKNINFASMDLGYTTNCPGYQAYGHWNKVSFENITATTHVAKRYCGTCNAVYSKTTESHYRSTHKANTDGKTHTVICACKKEYITDEAHVYGNWVAINSKQCQRTCTKKGCNYPQVEDHNFVDGECTKCGWKENVIVAITDTADKEYYII